MTINIILYHVCPDMMYEKACCSDEAASHQLPMAAAFWITQVVSNGGMFKLNTKFDTDLLLYLFNHFECDGHTVHMLTQHLLPPPTSTVKLSLFTHAQSSPLCLAARSHWCRANHSHYINSGWTFSVQTFIRICVYLCMYIYIYVCVCIRVHVHIYTIKYI